MSRIEPSWDMSKVGDVASGRTRYWIPLDVSVEGAGRMVTDAFRKAALRDLDAHVLPEHLHVSVEQYDHGRELALWVARWWPENRPWRLDDKMQKDWAPGFTPPYDTIRIRPRIPTRGLFTEATHPSSPLPPPVEIRCAGWDVLLSCWVYLTDGLDG